jgi:hypothetical protein
VKLGHFSGALKTPGARLNMAAREICFIFLIWVRVKINIMKHILFLFSIVVLSNRVAI